MVFNIILTHRRSKFLSLGGRYIYKILAKKRLPLHLQVTIFKSLAVLITSYSSFSWLQVIILVIIEKG